MNEPIPGTDQQEDEQEDEIENCPLCPVSSLTKCAGIKCAWYDCRESCCVIVSVAKALRK